MKLSQALNTIDVMASHYNERRAYVYKHLRKDEFSEFTEDLAVTVPEAYKDMGETLDKIVAYRAAVYKANVPIAETTARLAFLKKHLDNLEHIVGELRQQTLVTTFEMVKVDNLAQRVKSTRTFTNHLDLKEIEEKVKATKAEIKILGDKLHAFNHETELEDDLPEFN